MTESAAMRNFCCKVFTCFMLISYCQATANDTRNETSLDHEFRLKNYLLSPARYNPLVRPKRNHSEPLVIFIAWVFIALMHVSWTDDYLTWNPDDYGGLNQTYLIGKHIWTPKLMGSNAIGSHFLENILDDAYHITSRGSVTVSTSGVIVVSCFMNPENFPFDCQSCSVILNFGFNAKGYIKFKVPNHTENTWSAYGSHVWSLVSTSSVVPRTNAGTSFYFDIVVKRKPMYYVSIIVIPSVILSIVTVAVYFIPAEEGEKIGCGMTVLLAFMVFLSQMEDHLPENSDVTPIMGIYFMMIMSGCGLVTIDSIIMSNLIPASNTSTGSDEDEGVNKPEDFVGIKKRGLNFNKWTLCHYTLGGVSFLVIIAAHVVLIEKSVSASCDT